MNMKQWLRRFFRGKAASGSPEREWTELTDPADERKANPADDFSAKNRISDHAPRESAAKAVSPAGSPANVDAEGKKVFQSRDKERKKSVEKRLLNALAGMSDPFDGEKALSDFFDLGWETTGETVLAFLTGRRPCLNAYLKKIIEYYPDECSVLFSDHFEEIGPERRLLFWGCGFGGAAEDIATAVEELLPEMDGDDLPRAFSVLAAVPSDKGNDLLAAYLKNDDWRIALKAAVSLEKAGAKDKIAAIRTTAAREEFPTEGFLEIARRMEGN